MCSNSDLSLDYLKPMETKSELKIGTWNVLGMNDQDKRLEILRTLESKNVDICSIQETKMDEEGITEEEGYTISLHSKKNKNQGMGFMVKRGIKFQNIETKSRRITAIRLEKRERYNTKQTGELRTKIYKIEKKNNSLIILNVHAPHMGTTRSDPSRTNEFYDELEKIIESVWGWM